MANILKTHGVTVLSNATTGTNVGLAKTVKVMSVTAGDLVISTANKESVIGTICMFTGETVYITKNPTDELSTSDNAASWKFSPVSIRG